MGDVLLSLSWIQSPFWNFQDGIIINTTTRQQNNQSDQPQTINPKADGLRATDIELTNFTSRQKKVASNVSLCEEKGTWIPFSVVYNATIIHVKCRWIEGVVLRSVAGQKILQLLTLTFANDKCRILKINILTYLYLGHVWLKPRNSNVSRPARSVNIISGSLVSSGHVPSSNKKLGKQQRCK